MPVSVSIIMPMKNAAEYVTDTVVSVLAQTFSDWELIAVDDCSTDNGKTLEIMRSFSAEDVRINLVPLSQGKGSSGARNEGLHRAKGRFIAFLDSDDIWHPGYLETMLSNIDSCKVENAAIYFCGYRRMDENCSEAVLPDYSLPGIRTYRQMLNHCPMFPSITIIDTEKLSAPFFFREELKSLRDDYALILDIMHQGHVAVGFPHILADYRMRSDSVTASKYRMIIPQWRVYRKVLHLSYIESVWHLVHWGVNGLIKYRRH